MSNVHIYTAKEQPATRFIDRHFNPPMWTRFKPGALIWCYACGKRRRARNLTVQVFYDGLRFYCKRGFGCRDKDGL